MVTIESAIKKIQSGEITQDTDESGAGGFWDLAFEQLGAETNPKRPELQECLYRDLWQMYDTLTTVTKRFGPDGNYKGMSEFINS